MMWANDERSAGRWSLTVLGLLPAVLLAVALEMLHSPRRGNGSMILGMKREGVKA